MPGPRGTALSFATTSLLPDGRVLAAGGYDDDIRPLARVSFIAPAGD